LSFWAQRRTPAFRFCCCFCRCLFLDHLHPLWICTEPSDSSAV